MTFLNFTRSEKRAALFLALLVATGGGVRLYKSLHPHSLPGYRLVRRIEAPADHDAPHASAQKLSEGLDPGTAPAEDLELLPGVGPGLAERIVAHRTAHGPYKKASDLLAVPGIGPRTLARITPYLRFP